jgi:hypothetical protein
MTRALPKGTRFEVPQKGNKKYVALVPTNGTILRVAFGHSDYEHYRDSVPRSLGGGKWSHKNHNDKARRANYRARHGGHMRSDGSASISHRFSPAWFSYHFLW